MTGVQRLEEQPKLWRTKYPLYFQDARYRTGDLRTGYCVGIAIGSFLYLVITHRGAASPFFLPHYLFLSSDSFQPSHTFRKLQVEYLERTDRDQDES